MNIFAWLFFYVIFLTLMGNWSTMQTKLSSYGLILLRSLEYASKVAPNCDFWLTVDIRNIILTMFSVFIQIFASKYLHFSAWFLHVCIHEYLFILWYKYMFTKEKYKLHYKNVSLNEKKNTINLKHYEKIFFYFKVKVDSIYYELLHWKIFNKNENICRYNSL